jgi:hypothetical protein
MWSWKKEPQEMEEILNDTITAQELEVNFNFIILLHNGESKIFLAQFCS